MKTKTELLLAMMEIAEQTLKEGDFDARQAAASMKRALIISDGGLDEAFMEHTECLLVQVATEAIEDAYAEKFETGVVH